jgi:pyruvate dehydrogenase E2 component (dihydrolipoamide acetyltransferase)
MFICCSSLARHAASACAGVMPFVSGARCRLRGRHAERTARPVIRDVDRKGIVDIARETSELAAKARDGKLGPAEMSGATFTISSLGSIGGTTFTPIINAPEVAILGACRADIRPVWDGTAFVPRLMQPLSVSYDHRVIDGANAARFAVEIKHALTDLRRVLL